jgi:myo-inositol 2-dehydrogenase/D-chiro-inositol 1-dehydrogenase
VEVFGSLGNIVTSNNFANNAVISTSDSVRRDVPLNFFIERYTESYVAEVTAFVNAIVDDKPVPVTGADGRAPVVLGMAARKSYDEGRPVKVTEIDKGIADLTPMAR